LELKKIARFLKVEGLADIINISAGRSIFLVVIISSKG
jgi:hypothetical protein